MPAGVESFAPGYMNVSGSTSGNNVNLANVQLDVWSKEVLFQAQPILRFESIAQIQDELSVLPGNTIKFLKYASLGGTSALVEGTPMATDTLSTSVIPITVSEQGKAISVSEMLLKSSFEPVMDRSATLLGMHYAKNRDGLIRDALYGGANVLYAQAGGTALSRADLVSTSTFDVSLCRDAAEFLATNKAPKINGDAYVAFVHPHQGRYLRQDPAWINVRVYAQTQEIFQGEIGRVEDIRFIETTQIDYIPTNTQQLWSDGINSTNTTSVAANPNAEVYRAIVVGDYSVGIGQSLPVEMRDNGVEDFGRKHSLAYYGIWGAGQIEVNFSTILETA
jgi:N4-gp56 family major capsid protein